MQLFGVATKQHTSEPSSSKDNREVSERCKSALVNCFLALTRRKVCSNAAQGTEGDEIQTHGSGVLQAGAAESEFGSDPFEAIGLENKPKT